MVRLAENLALNTVRSRFAELREMDDAGVVAAHLAGEEEAFSVLMERYQGRLLNFIYRTIGDRERAEDLVQEAFIRIHRHLGRFDTTRKFSTWAYTIASNLAKNELRNRARNPVGYYQGMSDDEDDRPWEFEDETARPDEDLTRRELQGLIAASVATLPPHHREVFVLRELEGRSYEEIAEITKSNLGTVKSRLNRARTAFAAHIGPRLD